MAYEVTELEQEATAMQALENSNEWKSAGRIIKHLWTIFVLLPIVLAVLFAIVK